MNTFFKIVAYISISILLSVLEHFGNSSFFNEFTKNIIPLLATILALNIAASGIIAGELSRLKKTFPDADLKDVSKESKHSFIFQISFIIGLVVVLLCRDFLIEQKTLESAVNISANACIIGVFLYFLETIYDLSCSLFNLIDFNSKNNN